MLRALLSGFLTLLVTLALGCSDDSEEPKAGCTSDQQCEGGRVCLDSACRPADSDGGDVDVADMQLQDMAHDLATSGDMIADSADDAFMCEEGQSFNPITGQCVPLGPCFNEAECPIDEYCELQTSQCVELPCQMSESECPSDAPYREPEDCRCVECLSAAECDPNAACVDGVCVE